VHVDQVAAARLLVQLIHVLRHDPDLARMIALEVGERPMRGIGLHRLMRAAAHVVELVHAGRIARKALGRGDLAIVVARPDAARVAERRDAAFGGKSGSRQNDDPLVVHDRCVSPAWTIGLT